MGIAAELFYQIANEDTLAWRVKPSDEQRERQMERWNDLRDHLVEELAEATGCRIYNWLQGSYKFATQIRPARKGGEFDIDLGIYFQWSGLPNNGSFGPLELKNFVQDSCEAYASCESNDATGVAEPKAKCSRVHFDEDFHIDVPCYHLDQARDARALATAADAWEDSDPKAIYKWWKEKTAELDRSRVRRVVRYLKMWAALKFFAKTFAPSSILLTILVAETLNNFRMEDFRGDDELLKVVLSLIIDRLRSSKRVGKP